MLCVRTWVSGLHLGSRLVANHAGAQVRIVRSRIGCQVCPWGFALWRTMQERRCSLCTRAWDSRLHVGSRLVANYAGAQVRVVRSRMGVRFTFGGLALWRIMQERKCAFCARAWVSGLPLGSRLVANHAGAQVRVVQSRTSVRLALGVSPCGESCRSADAHCEHGLPSLRTNTRNNNVELARLAAQNSSAEHAPQSTEPVVGRLLCPCPKSLSAFSM